MINKRVLEATSKDKFLGGEISLFQPIDGYRANIDSVFLASAITAAKGQTVLDLGCGVGAVSICLMARVPKVKVVGVEIQKRYAELARLNFKINGFEADILNCCINQIPPDFKELKYDYVFFNPPYFLNDTSMGRRNFEKQISKIEGGLILDDWVNVAIRRCAVKGKIVMIHKVERLSQILKAFESKIGGVEILPIVSKKGDPAKRILIRGEKGSAAPLKILDPFHVHEGEKFGDYNKNFTVKAERILRHSKELFWS